MHEAVLHQSRTGYNDDEDFSLAHLNEFDVFQLVLIQPRRNHEADIIRRLRNGVRDTLDDTVVRAGVKDVVVNKSLVRLIQEGRLEEIVDVKPVPFVCWDASG